MRYLRPRNAAHTVARKAKKEYFCIGGACRARIEKLLRQKMKPSKAITLLAAAVLALTAAAQTAHDTVTTEKPVTVIFLSDLHVSPGAESEARLRRAVERINRTRPMPSSSPATLRTRAATRSCDAPSRYSTSSTCPHTSSPATTRTTGRRAPAAHSTLCGAPTASPSRCAARSSPA